MILYEITAIVRPMHSNGEDHAERPLTWNVAAPTEHQARWLFCEDLYRRHLVVSYFDPVTVKGPWDG